MEKVGFAFFIEMNMVCPSLGNMEVAPIHPSLQIGLYIKKQHAPDKGKEIKKKNNGSCLSLTPSFLYPLPTTNFVGCL